MLTQSERVLFLDLDDGKWLTIVDFRSATILDAAVITGGLVMISAALKQLIA